MGHGDTLRLAQSYLPDATVQMSYPSVLILEAGTTVQRVGLFAPPPWIHPGSVTSTDGGASSTIINRGEVLGDVRLFAGNDRYDGPSGRVGGTVFGYAGDDVLIGGELADSLDGGLGDDVLISGGGANILNGGAGNDLLNLSQGGDDAAFGGAGDDGIYFGAALTAADSADGGEGSDQLGLQGTYAGLTLGAASLVAIETLVLLPGSDTRFGDTSGALYSYNLTSVNANVAAGALLTINMNTLRAGENVTFNGSAEADGSFLFFGGFGTETLTGGLQSDGFYFGGTRFGASDQVTGGTGADDQLGLQGNFTGANAVVFGANQLIGIETIAPLSGTDTRFSSTGSATYSYDLTLNDGNTAAGGVLTVNGNRLTSAETLRVDGSAELDGRLQLYGGAGADILIGGAGNDRIFGGGGADTMRGGAGNDIFLYLSAADSTAASRDHISDFAAGDQIDLSGIDASAASGDQAFTFVGTNAFSGAAGELRAYQSDGSWLIEADTDGDKIADLVIGITTMNNHQLTSSDFIL